MTRDEAIAKGAAALQPFWSPGRHFPLGADDAETRAARDVIVVLEALGLAKFEQGRPRQLGPFAEGTVVRLKTGGPDMTVEDTRRDGVVSVAWFEGTTLVRGAWRPDALVVVQQPRGHYAEAEAFVRDMACTWKESARSSVRGYFANAILEDLDKGGFEIVRKPAMQPTMRALIEQAVKDMPADYIGGNSVFSKGAMRGVIARRISDALGLPYGTDVVYVDERKGRCAS
jgi:uncharacterized protein YodC (DUF2158 family)